MLVMLMFAAIFEVVADTMSAQQGIAKNDQKARTLTIIMKEDLEHRTFRRVVPFYPGQDTGTHGPFYSAQQRRGYFSISENDPDNNTDDVLAFTAQFPVPISGRATLLDPLLVSDGSTPPQFILTNQNQPEFDDGSPLINRIGVSRTVEIVYFLRHGNLYRRVMLVREPYDDEGTDNVQPGELLTGNYISEDINNNGILDAGEDTNKNDVLNSVFWRDFDYSAYRDFLNNPGPKFHGTDSMNNDSQTPGTVFVDGKGTGLDTRVPAVLGVPFFRFGHSPSLRFGIPREFVDNQFIGRFTTQETAHSAFGYPGMIPTSTGAGDPYSNPGLTYDTDTGLVKQFRFERFRRGEDILLSNVHEFDIKVWDDYQEADFDGDFPVNGIFENEDLNNDGVLSPGEDADSNGLLDVEDINKDGQFDSVLDFVNLGHNRRASTGAPLGYYNRTIFPHPQNGPYGLRNLKYGNRYDTWHPFDPPPPTNPPPFGLPPYRPLHPFNGDDRVPGTFQDDDYDGKLDNPGERGWLGSDDEVPLKAIQITIRFFDVSSDQMRQLTLIHTLTD